LRWLSLDAGATRTGVWFLDDFDKGKDENVMRGVDTFSVTKGKNEDRYAYFVRLRRTICTHFDANVDVAIIEGYAYGAQTITYTAEVKGVLIEAMRFCGANVVVMPVGTWKSISGFYMKKDTKTVREKYIDRASKMAGVRFDSTDSADAFLMWWATDRILKVQGGGNTVVRLRKELQAAMQKERTLL
jgi:hypothetical protein